ncbi:sialic acid-binding Ig-like lectin 5 [Stigmatopora nigra]
MFFLAWASLLYHVSVYAEFNDPRSHAPCPTDFCIHLSKTFIVSEVGLCAVIPCSFVAADFVPQSIVWFKCPTRGNKCSDSDIIFHSKNDGKIQEGYKDRVRMLEDASGSATSGWNCTIIINDLKFTDAGAYKLRVNGLFRNKMDGYSFQERVVLYVSGLRQKPTMTVRTLSDGEAATLTCEAPGRCSGHPPVFSWAWKGTGYRDDDSRTGVTNVTSHWSTLVSPFMLHYRSSLSFHASSQDHRREITCKVSYLGNIVTEKTTMLNVTYMKAPSITGPTTVKRGTAMTLRCHVDSFPPVAVAWRFPNPNATNHNATNLQHEPRTDATVTSADLVIPNATTTHSGRYECAAANYTAHVDVRVTWFDGILPDSGCLLRDRILTCTCLSSGVPNPNLTWPTLENRTLCSATTIISGDRVNSTIEFIVHDAGTLADVECVSAQDDERDQKTFHIPKISEKDQAKKSFLTSLTPEVFIAFLGGALLSAILCQLFRNCCRNSKKTSGTLEMEVVDAPEVRRVQSSSPSGVHFEADALSRREHGLENGGEVEYADINFSALRRNDKRETVTDRRATEYAEIKTKEDGDMLPGGKDGEQKSDDRTPVDHDEEEEENLYSSVEEAMIG